MERKLIPLYTLSCGGRFRIPSLPQVFQKLDNEQVICLQDHFVDGTLVVSMVPACGCLSPEGKIFVTAWWDWVEEVE